MTTGPLPAIRQCCCGCWSCLTAPESVSISNPSYSECCNIPNGTFIVGAAATSTIGSRNNYYKYNIDTHRFEGGQVVFECHWVWFYIFNDFFCCNGGSAQLPSFFCTGPTAHTICQTNPKIEGVLDPQTGQPVQQQTGQYAWAVAGPTVYIRWLDSPKKIIVVISYTYYFRECLNSGGGNFSSITVWDEYIADVTCDSLPATINWTARYREWDGGLRQDSDDIQYGSSYGGPYTFTVCPYIPSVNLTYA